MPPPAAIISRPGDVSFQTVLIQPPSSVYLTVADKLRLSVWNSNDGPPTISVSYRLLTPKGEIVEGSKSLIPTTDRIRNSLLIPMAEGFLLSVTVQGIATDCLRGETFVQVDAVRSDQLFADRLALLISDYITNFMGLGWPGGLQRQSVEGPGVMRFVLGTNPAAGVEINETVPTNARWKMHGFHAELVTDVTVANRRVRLFVDSGATRFYEATTLADQAASLTVRYTGADVGHQAASINQGGINIQLPTFSLTQGFRINTSTANFQAGDNWAAPQMLVEEWIED